MTILAAAEFVTPLSLTFVAALGYVLIGALAGWVTGGIVNTTDGLFLDVLAGVVGALIGGFLLTVLVGTASSGPFFALFAAILGAVILLALVRLVRRLVDRPKVSGFESQEQSPLR
jgi:uncharacterized membrane protein YeaQ/YmgE (transglycosylase-associated protein family)